MARDGSTSTVELSSSSSANLFPGAIIPDGQGGVLASWTILSINPPAAPQPYQAAYVSGGAVIAAYPMPMAPTQILNGPDGLPLNLPLVLGENGTAFASYVTNLVSFSLSTGSVNWNYQSAQQSALHIVAAAAGNGLVATSTTQNVDTILGIDATGNATSTSWNGSGVQFALGSSWLSFSNGSSVWTKVAGGGFDLASSVYPFLNGTYAPTHAATGKIPLQVLKVNEANVDDSFIRDQIKVATDYWNKRGVLFDWNGVPIGVPACDLQQWPSCTPGDTEHSIFNVITDSSYAPDPNNQLSEVYRRYANDPQWFKGITVLFVHSLRCNGTDTDLAYTLGATANTPGRGSFLNVIVAESFDCSGYWTTIPDATLDHEFGHVFQLIHTGTNNVPLIGLYPDIFSGVSNLILPATNLMCGPLDEEDKQILGYLGLCSISRQFKFLMDFQVDVALQKARSLAE